MSAAGGSALLGAQPTEALTVIEYALARNIFRTPGGRDAPMWFREGTNDWNTIWASMNEDEYRLPPVSGLAVDVGGYAGSVGISLAIDNPDLRVVIVEPVPPNGDLIERNIAENGLADRVELIRGAVGRGGESVDIWYGYRGNPSLEHHAFVGNSTLAYDYGGEADHDTATYTALGLADLLEYGDISLLKIDTEGAEWVFLQSPLVADLPEIVGEWHPVRGHTIGDFIALLGDTHTLTFSGPQAGPGGFRAVRHG